MSRETVKSLILVILVGISFLLTFILWSYQPNYDYFYDTSYVSEVDIGGVEKSRNDVIQPKNIIFRNQDNVYSFIDPIDQEAFYQEINSVVLYNYDISDANGRPDIDKYVEIIFPDAIPADMMMNLFTFEDEINPPSWSFKNVFLTMNEENRTLQLSFLSVDGNQRVNVTIEKSETFEQLDDYIDGHPLLEEYLVIGSEEEPIYLPKDSRNLASKTLVASHIEPEQFINALFANPNLVTSNEREAYFTDGQRGMRILQDGRRLEYINPIEPTTETEESETVALDLIDQSMTNINEHKGWTNNFLLEEINLQDQSIKYRLYYDGYPIFNHYSLSVMTQSWRDQVLFEYERPLIKIGNLLNTEDIALPSGEKIVQYLEEDRNYQLEDIQDIEVGYYLRYIGDSHSLVLEPNWFILYDDEWIRYDSILEHENLPIEGGD